MVWAPDCLILIKCSLAGALEVVSADLGLDLVCLLLRGLLAGSPEVALAGLRLDIVVCYYEAY